MRVCFPHRPGEGGPGSFQSRIEEKLQQLGHQVLYSDDTKKRPDIVFIVGGTKKLFWLAKMRFLRVPILYRLDGLNWIHRIRFPGAKLWLLNELRNALAKFTHALLADHVVYQSKFVKDWWFKIGWRRHSRYSVIYNGVTIEPFNRPMFENPRLVCLEGTLDYTPYALELINRVCEKIHPLGISVEIFGSFANKKTLNLLDPRVRYGGILEREFVKDALRGSIYLSLDVNPACPNTVIEAMSVGTPVVGYNTGALSELVDDTSGILVNGDNDPWSGKLPNIDHLVSAILIVSSKYENFSEGAFKRAVDNFSLDSIVGEYISLAEQLVEERG